MNTAIEQRGITTEELAARLGCSADTLRRMRRLGRGPKYLTLSGGSVRYFEDAIAEWVAEGGNVAIKREAKDADAD